MLLKMAQTRLLDTSLSFRSQGTLCHAKASIIVVTSFLSQHQSAKTKRRHCMSIRTYVFSVLHSIFQYDIKLWLCALQLSGSRECKVIMIMHVLTMTMNTISGL